MAVVDKTYVADGTTRIFSSDFEVFSDSHVKVFEGPVGAMLEVSKNKYDIINNAIAYDLAPTVGTIVTIQVASTPDDLLNNVTDVGIVANISADVTTVAANAASVQVVSTNVSSVNIVTTNIANVNTVATNIANVNTAGGNTANINAVVANAANVTAVGQDLLEPTSEINTVATNIANVNTVGSNIADVNTVAGNTANINAVVGNSTNINTVATANANVTTVASNIANVNTVATNIANVNSVATTVVPNIAEILLADNNAATATAQAVIATTGASTATTKASEASVSAAHALASELAATAIVTAPLTMAIGNINSPLLDMPLKNSLAMKAGVGSATFTRASTATYIDRYGILKTAAIDEPRFEKEGYLNEGTSTNLLTYSEQFDNGAWTKYLSSIVANTPTVLDPYGTNLADKLVENSTTNIHSMYQFFTPASSTLTASFFVKAGEISTCRIVTYEPTTPANSIIADFNLITKTAVAGIGTTIAASIVEIGNGWFRISATTNSAALVQTTVSLQLTRLGILSYLGDGTSGIYVFGAQLEALPFATSYIPTTTAAVTRSADVLQITAKGNTGRHSSNLSLFADFDSFGLIAGTYPKTIFMDNTTVSSNIQLLAGNGTFYQSYLYKQPTESAKYNLVANAKYRHGASLTSTIGSFYVNGTLVGSTSMPSLEYIMDKLYIGSQNGTTHFHHGHISNVRIYDKALTAQEVALA